MAKRAIVIGAGLTGMSAGIHLAKNGVEADIFEMAPWPGGMCTAWERGGYWFDGCIHWMVGTKTGDGFNKLYREVGALTKDTVIYNADHIVEEIDGVTYEIPMELTAFRTFLRTLAPEDAAPIDAMCGDIARISRASMPGGFDSFFDKVKAGFTSIGMLAMFKHVKKTMREYVSRFQNETLRTLLLRLMPAEFTASGLFMMLGTRMGGNAGYPMGGARDVMRRMVENFRAAGGRLHLNAPVEEVIVENGCAVGVRVRGEEHRADMVIAACDMHALLNKQLKGRYAHPQLDAMLKESPLFPPLALVSFGVKKRLGIPFAATCECPAGIQTSPDTKAHSLFVRSFDFDPSAAPEGKSSVMAMLDAPLAYWQALRAENIGEYRKQKQALSDAVAAEIEVRFPGFTEAIEVTDVSTPATYVRLTDAYQASYEGFMPTPQDLFRRIDRTVPGVRNMILAGQWVTPGGGICTAVDSGKSAARTALRELRAK